MVTAAFDLDVDVRCVNCGALCELPAAADRVFEVDGVLFADSLDRCKCGSTKVRVETKVSHGQGGQV